MVKLGNGLLMESASLRFILWPVWLFVAETKKGEETACCVTLLGKQKGEGYQSKGAQI